MEFEIASFLKFFFHHSLRTWNGMSTPRASRGRMISTVYTAGGTIFTRRVDCRRIIRLRRDMPGNNPKTAPDLGQTV